MPVFTASSGETLTDQDADTLLPGNAVITGIDAFLNTRNAASACVVESSGITAEYLR
ncbi:hypothetical protein GTPT_2465 [Tatumella ptyseos ATCC 33301]|uniref:Uncharacterized protein n=1 Tax=Tatumella ptyseos ATCC 33301 TaxID=1005995 RepID=A0A085JCS9_9GAMM|nr:MULTISPECIES: hypothetical protein [Tatumella]KFD18275.1 hypothetical protein GTPT_2465 [Tatumella ptyseos ATCC 33301]